MNLQSILESANVLFISSRYDVINKYIIDKVKTYYRREERVDIELLGEFGVGGDSVESGYVIVDFDRFMSVFNTPSVSGKWLCIVGVDTLTKKQVELLDNYMKKTSSNGLLVLYMDYNRKYMNNNLIKNSKVIHLLNLRYLNKSFLMEYVRDKFIESGVDVSKAGLELFVYKLGNDINNYDNIIADIANKYNGYVIGYNEIKESLKGVNTYVIDDFVEKLFSVNVGDKIDRRKVIYKVLGDLLSDMKASEVVGSLRDVIDLLIEIRVLMNKGVIPVGIKFSMREVRGKILEGSKLHSLSDYRLKELIYMASKITLNELLNVRIILDRNNLVYNEVGCKRILYSVIHR
ncbi:MAG: hypothetical protein QXD03_04500 [Candidatus Anstonellales archaeon]